MVEKKAEPKSFNINKLMLPAIGGVIGVIAISIIVTSMVNVIGGGLTGGTVAAGGNILPLKTILDNVGDYISFNPSNEITIKTSGLITNNTVVGGYKGVITSGPYSIEIRGCFAAENEPLGGVEYALTGKIRPKDSDSTTCLCEYKKPGETEFKTSGLTINNVPFYPYIAINNCYLKSQDPGAEGIEFRCSRGYAYYYSNFYFDCISYS